ncbi:hypothetical protein PV08_07027 [Exophiala spinifera]|uniref:Glyoxalase-like domain-containing protein n=1 Tax=Exophiala spinifera TaxID=91928 RepID=A0A0D2B6C6_9EURO|nr:uncharacterized protein PV08_07027 [Exophiala spinifera]KIW14245.1 hypothetical protein PV08_07027 [Exophiala spinifera]
MSSEANAWSPPAEGSPCWVEIPARDIEKLKTFYSNLFPTWTWTSGPADPGHQVATFQFKDPKGEGKSIHSGLAIAVNNSLTDRLLLGLGGGLVKMPDSCGPSATHILGSGVTVYHMVESLEKAR